MRQRARGSGYVEQSCIRTRCFVLTEWVVQGCCFDDGQVLIVRSLHAASYPLDLLRSAKYVAPALASVCPRCTCVRIRLSAQLVSGSDLYRGSCTQTALLMKTTVPALARTLLASAVLLPRGVAETPNIRTRLRYVATPSRAAEAPLQCMCMHSFNLHSVLVANAFAIVKLEIFIIGANRRYSPRPHSCAARTGVASGHQPECSVFSHAHTALSFP